MKVSLVVTVLNEEKSIDIFLKSVLGQSKLVDELVVVDGGSSDSTIERIAEYKSRLNLKIIQKKGNRSVGRNTAVKNSANEIIAVTDAGCILDKNWLVNIIKPFENSAVEVVAGYYKPKTHSVFEKCLATYTCVMPDKVNPNKFLPSSRSIAFKKTAWKETRGYPEELDTCEDLVFAKKLKTFGFKFEFAKNAIVYWPQRKNIFSAFKQFLSYAIGDGRAFYVRPYTPLLFVRYIFGVIIIVLYVKTRSNFWLFTICCLLLAYFAWSIWKNYRYVLHKKAFIYLPLLQITSDIAVIMGMFIGLSKKYLSDII